MNTFSTKLEKEFYTKKEVVELLFKRTVFVFAECNKGIEKQSELQLWIFKQLLFRWGVPALLVMIIGAWLLFEAIFYYMTKGG